MIVGCLTTCLTMFYSLDSQSARTIHGKVQMGGAVVESACALHPDSHQQEIWLKDISIDHVIRNEGSELHPFEIKLVNCNPERANKENWSAFQITFDGPRDGDYFSMQGNAKGLAIEIQDDRGYVAAPGVPMQPHPVPTGEKTLKYNLRLVGNAALLQVGDHFSVIKYKLEYY